MDYRSSVEGPPPQYNMARGMPNLILAPYTLVNPLLALHISHLKHYDLKSQMEYKEPEDSLSQSQNW